jgi:hypothetical protein
MLLCPIDCFRSSSYECRSINVTPMSWCEMNFVVTTSQLHWTAASISWVEATGSSKMLLFFYQATCHHIGGDSNLPETNILAFDRRHFKFHGTPRSVQADTQPRFKLGIIRTGRKCGNHDAPMIDCYVRVLPFYDTFHTIPRPLICRLQFIIIIIIIKNWVTHFFSLYNSWGDCNYWIFIIVLSFVCVFLFSFLCSCSLYSCPLGCWVST